MKLKKDFNKQSPQSQMIIGIKKKTGQNKIKQFKFTNKNRALHNWGLSLMLRAISKSGPEQDKLFELAVSKFKEALELNHRDSRALLLWGKKKKKKSFVEIFSHHFLFCLNQEIYCWNNIHVVVELICWRKLRNCIRIVLKYNQTIFNCFIIGEMRF